MNKLVAIAASFLRLAAACALVWVCWQDWPRLEALQKFDDLPPYDVAAEANELFKQNRLTDAEVLIDEALAQKPDDDRLKVIRQGIENERRSWARQLSMGARGAITGRGDTVEGLTGAVVADLFVFGDVRDLVIQSGHWLKGEDTDEMIVALSAGGILLTVAPTVDLGAALLKFARRMGAISDAFAHAVAQAARRAVKERKADAVAEMTQDVTTLAQRARPAGAVSIIKHIDDPKLLHLAAQFSKSPEGLRALLVDPETTLRWLGSGWPHAQEWLLKASTKGRAGLTYLAANSSVMFQFHPLIGMLKGLYKGNIPDLLQQLGYEYSMVALGLAVGWAVFELVLLLGRAAWPSPGISRPPPPVESVPAG